MVTVVVARLGTKNILQGFQDAMTAVVLIAYASGFLCVKSVRRRYMVSQNRVRLLTLAH